MSEGGQQRLEVLANHAFAGSLSPDIVLAAVEAANSAIVVADPRQHDCPLVYVNQGFAEITGYSQAESLGRNCRFLQVDAHGRRDDGTLGLPHDRQQAGALAALRDAASGRFTNVVVRNYRKDGTPFWNDLYLTPVFDGDTCTAIVGVQNDVTDRVDAERELADRDRLLGGIYQAVPAAMGVVERRADGGFAHVSLNAAACQTFGVSEERAKGQRLAELGLTEEAARQWEDAFRDCLTRREPIFFRCLIATAEPLADRLGAVLPSDGLRHLRVAVAPIEHADGVDADARPRLCYVATDTSALERSEADRMLLEAAVEHADEGVVITRADLDRPGPEIVYVNGSFTRTTGWSRAEIVGKSPRVLQGSMTDPTVLRRLRTDLDRHGSFRGETVNYCKDGTPFTLEWNVTPIKDADGVVRYWVSNQRDVSRRRDLEREVLEIQASEQGRIARDLHDSVAQTLNAIAMRADLLKLELGDVDATVEPIDFVREVAELARLAKTAAEQARGISHSLLPVEVVRSGIMTALQRLASHTAEMWKIECRFTYERPVLIEDRERATNLYRIAQEAIGNAVRHGRATQILIGLSDVDSDADAGAIDGRRRVLTIRDNGIGIPAKFADAANNGVGGAAGDGVGLTTLRYRANLVGGNLRVRRGDDASDRPGTIVTIAFTVPDRAG